MKVYNVVAEPWMHKIQLCFRGARKNSLKGTLLILNPIIITWRLWNRQCKAWMKDKMELDDMVWLSIRYWISIYLAESKIYTSQKDEQLIAEFHVKPYVKIQSKPCRVYWEKPPIIGSN